MPIPLTLGREGNRISVSGDLEIAHVRRVLAVLHETIQVRGHRDVSLDFSNCNLAFSGAMLPICAQAMLMQLEEVEFDLSLPVSDRLRRLFQNTGWAHYISPKKFDPPDRQSTNRQFPATQYRTHEEQETVLNELLEKLLAVIPNFNRAAFAAVEWALNEISDNVLNHSQSPIGGLLQLSVFDVRRNRVEFTVSDAGVGVPGSLRPTRSEIRTDADALMQSVRSGVTRNPQDFQGNGLYGTLEICRVGGGKFSVNAGNGILFSVNETVTARNDQIQFCGTSVDLISHEPQPGSLYELVGPYSGTCQNQRANHADEPNPVPARCVAAGILHPLWQRGAVRCGAQRDALAGWISLPAVRRCRALCRGSWRTQVVSVPGLSPSNVVDRWHGARQHEAATAHLVPGHLPHQPVQDRIVVAGAHAPPGHQLPHRLAGAPQADGGHGRT